MGIVGGRRGPARPHVTAVVLVISALLAATLAGCSDAGDQAHTVETRLGRLPQVADAVVAVPSRDQAPAITVTYERDVDSAALLAGLVAEVEDVAGGLDYPAYPLTLVPAVEPDSALTLDAALPDAARSSDVLDAWSSVTGAALGPVRYDAQPDGETITVDSDGGAAHDIAEVRRLGYGTPRTTWVFRAGPSTFTATGGVRASDPGLFQAVQRNAGTAGQPVWAPAWQLDRRAGHVRLDLDVRIGSDPVSAAQLTVGRYGDTLAPLARTSLTTLAGTRMPAYLRLHGDEDVFGVWSSGRTPEPGRDPLARGWDGWLVTQAAAVS